MIGSLRLSLIIENGLLDPSKMHESLAKFKKMILKDLRKEDEEDIPFITLIGEQTEQSTLFTTANELVKLGFIGTQFEIYIISYTDVIGV